MKHIKKIHFIKISSLTFVTASFALAAVASVASAADVNVRASTSVNARPLPPKIAPIRQGAADAQKDIQQSARTNRLNIIQNSENTSRDGRMERREDLRQLHASTTAALQANRASTTAAIKALREGFLKDIKARKDEKKKKLGEEAQGRVQKILGKIYNGLNAQIARLTRVDTWLKDKINTLRSQGKDVTTATSLLVAAETAFAKAKVDVEATSVVAREQSATTTSKEILKDLVNKAETSIKAAAKSYKAVAENIKPMLEINVSASSSTTTSAGN